MQNIYKVIVESDELIQETHPKTLIKTLENVKPAEQRTVQKIDSMAYAMPSLGRPKTVEGKYHTYTARLREELYDYAYSQVGRHKQFQSVNDYINQLIAKDMLSKKKN